MALTRGENMESLIATIKAKQLARRHHEKKVQSGFKRCDTFGSVESRIGFRRQTPVRIIQDAIENGKQMVDLSYRMLQEVPSEIVDLQHGVCFRANGPLQPRLQVALNANLLKELPSVLLQLDSITVLNLDNNRLTFLPPDIIQMVNLEMISLGRNRLAYLPEEIKRLPKLSRMTCFPNPFFEKTKNGQISELKPLSLRSQAAKSVLNASLKHVHVLPLHVSDELDHAAQSNRCACCKCCFVGSIDTLVWEDYLENEGVPFKVRLCSTSCHQTTFGNH